MVVGSKVKALEAKNTKLRRDLITAMDKANLAKEKAKALANKLKVEKQLMVKEENSFRLRTRRLNPWLPRLFKLFN